MRTMLGALSELYGCVQLDLREPPVAATNRPERRRRLFGLITAWDDRAYFRHQLVRLANDTPELIDDIGLTMDEVRAEVAKPFWRR